MYKLTFYVPQSHVDQVKEALFQVGAGRVGDYEMACWQCLGQGQFRPLATANPAIGKVEELTFVDEFKVEMICSDEFIKNVVKTLKEVHPYEQPGYFVIRTEIF